MLDGLFVIFVTFILLLMENWKILLANNVDPDQMPHYVASDLGLHCLPMTILWISRYERVDHMALLQVNKRMVTMIHS